jgi:hypothetical protein
MVGSEGVVVVQEAACRDLEVQWVQRVVVRLQERVVAEVVVQHLLAGSSTKGVRALHRDPTSCSSHHWLWSLGKRRCYTKVY